MAQVERILAEIDRLDPIERESLYVELAERALPRDLLRAKLGDPPTAGDHPSVVSTPEVCGGSARIVGTRVPVWALEQFRRLGVSEGEILRNYPTLRAADLVRAWEYVESHRTEVDADIDANEAA